MTPALAPARGRASRFPADPDLPGSAGLLDAGGRAALSDFLETRGWTCAAARPVQAILRPGRSCIVRFRVEGRGPRGEQRLLTLCLEARATREPPPEPGPDAAAPLPDPVGEVGPFLVWAWPYDPALPTLPQGVSGPHLRQRLLDEGIRLSAVSVQSLRYRPRNRAATRLTVLGGGGPARVVYGKVLRPERAERVRALGAILRRPRLPWQRQTGPRLGLPFAVDGEGLVLSTPVPGRSLREVLLEGGRLPSPARLTRLLDGLARLGRARGATDIPVCPSPERVARSTCRLLRSLVPEAAAVTEAVVQAVLEGAAAESPPRQLVHGDFYEAQVVVDDDLTLGLIDLDDVGLGDPLMDAATFSAHLLALALVAPTAKARILTYRAVARRHFLEWAGAAEASFAWREALAMLTLAAGPFRVLEPDWPTAVLQRLEVARRLANVASL